MQRAPASARHQSSLNTSTAPPKNIQLERNKDVFHDRDELVGALLELKIQAQNAGTDVFFVQDKKKALARKIKFQEATIRRLQAE